MMQPLLVGELARRLTEELGGRIDFKTKGEQLMRDDDGNGRVSAVICSREDGSYAKYTGSKAVVLATGDFSANRDMMYRYAPNYAPYIADEVYDGETNYDAGFRYGGLFKGDGQRMGLWVGAGWQKVFPNCVMGGFFGPGPRNLYSNFLGLLVNTERPALHERELSFALCRHEQLRPARKNGIRPVGPAIMPRQVEAFGQLEQRFHARRRPRLP